MTDSSLEHTELPPDVTLDLTHYKWDKTLQSIDNSDRIENYHYVEEIIDKTPVNICECYSHKNLKSYASSSPDTSPIQKTCPTIIIEKQIGSSSVAGVVYKIHIGAKPAALKVLPITDEELIEQNMKEIYIAKLLSGLVLSNISIFFPIVYNSYKCNDIIYPITSKFVPDSFKYAIFKTAYDLLIKILQDNNVDLTNVKNKLNLRRFKTSNILRDLTFTGTQSIHEFIQIITTAVNEKISSFNLSSENYINANDIKPRLEGDILISELAQGDLATFIDEILNKDEILSDSIWFNIIECILKGIKDMQSVNVIHNDLHIGNVLVLIKNDRITMLIHDFGNSSINDNWNADERTFDILKFLDNIKTYVFSNGKRTTSSMSSKFQTFIDIFIEFIEKNKSSEPSFMDTLISFFYHEKEEFLKSESTSGGKYKNKNSKKERKNIKSKKKRKNIKSKKNKKNIKSKKNKKN